MESMSRISSILDAARELTIEAGALRSARRGAGSGRTLSAAQLKRLLDSKHEREVLDGLRRIIAMDYQSLPTLQYFTPIIKNIASPSLEVKKLVYTYLLAHAEDEPQNALMSINTIVRSLSDANPTVRALALRVMSGIRVPEVSQIVSLYIKRSVGDMSPYVRRAAALAIPKCYRLDPQQLPQLIEYLEVLLGDRQYHVAAAAIMSFNIVCPDRFDLIHKHYRDLIRKLVDMDEWGQLAMLNLMTRYARGCFPRRTKKAKHRSEKTSSSTVGGAAKGFYDDDSEPEEGEENTEEIILDPDLALLLRALQPLLSSRNTAVVLSVARAYHYLAPPPPQTNYITSSIPPLIALLRGPLSGRPIVLTNLVQLCLAYPEPFLPYYTRFLVANDDTAETTRLKLEILTLLFLPGSPELRSLILAELAHFSHSADPVLVRDAVRALGRCAQASSGAEGDKATSAKCMRLLLAQLTSPHATLVAESLEVIRHLIQRDPQAHRGTVVQLAKNLDNLTAPQARASVIWLVGEFAGQDAENNIAADVVRILVKHFADEDESVKMQVILLAAKVYLHWLIQENDKKTTEVPRKDEKPSEQETADVKPDGDGWGSRESREVTETASTPREHPIPILWTYILLLARYDTSYDLRDRARLYKNLLLDPSSTSLASLLLLAPKPVPHVPSPGENKAGYALGSTSLVLGEDTGIGSQGLNGYEPIPSWVAEGTEPDAHLRDESGPPNIATSRSISLVGKSVGTDEAQTRMMTEKGNSGPPKTLDDWLNEDDDSNAEGDDDDVDDEDEDEEDSEESSEYEEVTDSEAETEEESDDQNGREHNRLVA